MPISDLVAGLYGALAVCASLVRRERNGRGDRIDIAPVDSILSFASYFAAQYLATGTPMQRSGNDHPVVAAYGLFRVTDGDIAIAPSNDAIYARLVACLGLVEELSVPEFATNEERMRNRPKVNAIISDRIGQQSRDHSIQRLNETGVPCSHVLSSPEAFQTPQIAEREMVIEVDHPNRGGVKTIGFPMKLTEAPCQVRLPAPELGADTDAVLASICYDSERISSLRSRGVI